VKENRLAARREARGTGFGGPPHPVPRTERTCSEIGTTNDVSQHVGGAFLFFCLGSTEESADSSQEAATACPCFFFFLHKGKGPEGPRIHFIKRGRYIIKLQPFSSKALGNLLSADKAKLFTNSTLEQKDEMQLGPRTPQPPLAGVLEA
jgi:hypothetical protein